MIYYEYDLNGWYLGVHEDSNKSNSTTLSPTGIDPDKAKWNGSSWIEDSTQKNDRVSKRQIRDQSILDDQLLLKNINPTTASNTEITDAMRALLRLNQK